MSGENILLSPASPFWTKILEHGRNITRHHIEIPKDDSNDDDDLSCVVIVGVGIAVVILMLIFNKYLNDDRPRRYEKNNLLYCYLFL